MYSHRFSRISMLLSATALSIILAGCSSQQPAKQNATNSSSTPTQTATSNTTGGGQNGSNTGSSNQTSTSTSNSSSTGGSNTSNTSTTSATNPQPHIILYPPTVWSMNTVHVAGRVIGGQPTGQAVVLAKYAGTNQTIARVQVPVSPNGQFAANVPIKGSAGPVLLKFEADYPGATAAGVTRYFNEIAMDSNDPVVMEESRQAVQNMGANFPILLPTWLPQTISVQSPQFPAYSTTLAAKSFTYTVQIFSTEKPFAVNDPAIAQTSNQVLASVDGTQFASAQAAENQLMYHANQALPNASTSSRDVWLTGNLHAIVYSDEWNSVVWHEGDWLMVVRGPSAAQNIGDAKYVAQILNTVYLPPTHGVVWIRNISDGTSPATPHTLVSFVEGANLYDVSAQDQIYNPLVLASSMKS